MYLRKHEQRALIEEGLAALSAIAYGVADMSGHPWIATFFAIKFGVDTACVAGEWFKHGREKRNVPVT